MTEIRLPDDLSPISPARTAGESSFVLVRNHDGIDALAVFGPAGEMAESQVDDFFLCSLTHHNAMDLALVFPWLSPQRIPEGRTSFGFGDRLGIATPGHIASLRGSQVFPILAQQSVRENARTGRTFKSVITDAIFGVLRAGYDSGYGADADHLKEIEDALEAADAGFTFFTCDPGDHVKATDGQSIEELRAEFDSHPLSSSWRDRYLNHSYQAGEHVMLEYGEMELYAAGVKYGAAISHAAEMYHELCKALPDGFDYEVSVDETDSPTSPHEHLFVALELHHLDVDFVSLAPRFVGAMEKGVDWRGDRDRFNQELRVHAEIARSVGGYRLSLHSGSDKFSLYPDLARETLGKCHVKTAGTSYLVALDVVARKDPALFRRIAAHSLEAFAKDKATYHISADVSKIPSIDSLNDSALPDLVASHDSRQVLHVAFGSVLNSPYCEDLLHLLQQYETAHDDALAEHLGRHIRLLGDEQHE